MSKYKIDKQFFPLSIFKPPIRNGKIVGFIGRLLKPPRSLWRDKEVLACKYTIPSFDGEKINVITIEPAHTEQRLPCLVYYHGGGFFFGASPHHYNIAREYALRSPCKVVLADYRLAPKNPFPIPPEDCYTALRWAYANADALNINRDRIAVGGDSAGGALAAAVCQMARDRNTDIPIFQLLIYPVTDRRMDTESNRLFTDTPMWNSSLSKKMWRGYLQANEVEHIAYASPAEATDLTRLPPAYVEVAEFDCLRDEGIAYSESLRSGGAPTVLIETKGTIHGFDAMQKSPISRAAVKERINYMIAAFYPNGETES